jgi:hypothetical protein
LTLSEAAIARPALPLAVIYLLGEPAGNNDPRIETLSKTQAFVALAQNQFARLANAPLFQVNFAALRQVVEKVPVRMIYRPHSLARLEQTFQMILADALSTEASQGVPNSS